MSRALIVTPEAEADILDGYLSYEEKQGGLGIRRAVVHTFPYIVFYTFGPESVHVLAVIHGAQDPAYIRSRLRV